MGYNPKSSEPVGKLLVLPMVELLESRKKSSSHSLTDRLQASLQLLFAFLLAGSLGAHADQVKRGDTAAKLRGEWRGAIYLLELRRKEIGEEDKPCTSAKKQNPSWATGFAIETGGTILTARHTFKRFEVKGPFLETEVCGWAHFSPTDGELVTIPLDLSKESLRLSESGDYALVKLQTPPPVATLWISWDRLGGKEILQADEVYFLGYDAPPDDTPKNATPKSEAKDMQNSCTTKMAECDMIGGVARGNSGAPVLSKDGTVVGIIIMADDERKDRSRFIHIGRLADFLKSHNVLPDNAGMKGVLHPTDAFFTDEEALRRQSFMPYGQTSVHTAFVKLRLKFAESQYNKVTYFSSFDERIHVSWIRQASPSSPPEVISRYIEEETGSSEKIWKAVLVFGSRPEPQDSLSVALGPMNLEWKIRANTFRWKSTGFPEGGQEIPWSIAFAEVEQEVSRPHWMVITDGRIMAGHVQGQVAALLTATIENPTEQEQTLKSIIFRATDPDRRQGGPCFTTDPTQTVTLRWKMHESVEELEAHTTLGGIEVPVKVEYSVEGKCSGYKMIAEVPLSELVPANGKKIVHLRMTQLPWEASQTGGPAIFPNVTSWPYKSVSFSTEKSAVIKPREFRFGE